MQTETQSKQRNLKARALATINRQTVAVGFAVLYVLLAFGFSGVFRFFFAAMALYLVLVMSYNFFSLRAQRLYTFWSWLRPLFFFASLFAIYFVLPSEGLRVIFLILSAVFIYFSESALHLISEQAIFLQTLFSYFGLCLGIFSLNFYFLPQTTIVLAALLLVTYLLGRASFENVPQTAAKKNFYAWLIAFGMAEICWALLFLPLHFTALALILFNCFYALWILSYYQLFNNLGGKKVSFYIIFPTIIIALILIVTPWR